MKKIIILMVLMLLVLSGCGSSYAKENNYKYKPIVTMEFAGYGQIKIELYPNIAPNTVANFVNLIEDGFYDNNTVHRIQPGFVLQGGDPTGTGTGGCGYTIAGEFQENGFNNTLSHERGVISMARSNNLNSAGSQFFIVLDDSAKTSLDGMYAGFGKVIEGMDIIDKMEENAEVINMMGILAENITITKATVDTFGETYQVQKY